MKEGYYYFDHTGSRVVMGNPSSEPICDPGYWKSRLDTCDGELHRSLFNGSIDQFQVIVDHQRETLREEVLRDDSILDAGCAYGRLLDILPSHWSGNYLGVDICPDFIDIARKMHLGREFVVGDLRKLPDDWTKKFDLCIVSSVRSMIIRHVGIAAWMAMEQELLRVSHRILYLTYLYWD